MAYRPRLLGFLLNHAAVSATADRFLQQLMANISHQAPLCTSKAGPTHSCYRKKLLLHLLNILLNCPRSFYRLETLR